MNVMTDGATSSNQIKIHPYSQETFPFREAIQALLGFKDLEHLHLQGGTPDELVTPGKDNHTPWHAKLYAGVKGSEFMRVYDAFLRNFVRSMFDESLVVQEQPTFRIHWVGNLGVGAFHKDKEYNHPEEETNFWVPVTPAFGTNTIWIESQPDRGDFQPQPVNYGQALVFPGCQLTHGNKVNDTGKTRVSFDFRVIPKSKWVDPIEPTAGIAFGRLRKIGDYYRLLE